MVDSDPSMGRPPRNPIDTQEQRIRDLARGGSDAGFKSTTHEGIVDDADIAYSVLHAAGLVRDVDDKEEKFVWPSVQLEQLYQEQVLRGRPLTFAIHSLGSFNHVASDGDHEHWRQDAAAHVLFQDPLVGLVGCSEPIAILETVNDNDALDPSSTITWLVTETIEEATAYCERVGWDHAKPGPGEEDGVYTSRTIYDNPFYLDKMNASLGDIDENAIGISVRSLTAELGLAGEDPTIETAMITGITHVARLNRSMRTDMLGSDDSKKHTKYLDPTQRTRGFNWAGSALTRELNQSLGDMEKSLGGHTQAKAFTKEDADIFVEKLPNLFEAVAAPHEVQAATSEALAKVIIEIMSIARGKQAGVQLFLADGQNAKALAWAQDVERSLELSVSTGCAAYSRMLETWSNRSY